MTAALSKPAHTISVCDLVEFVLRQGDLGGEREFVGSDRALAGIRGHQKIQRSRPTGYLTELPVDRVPQPRPAPVMRKCCRARRINSPARIQACDTGRGRTRCCQPRRPELRAME